MSSLFISSENVTSEINLLKGYKNTRGSHQHHTSKWTREQQQVSSLAFLPILGLIIFFVCSMLKVYKWSKDDARWKARGDVEFSDEEVNYGIIHVGDKDFCPIDIRSDGASVYDTVNSFRLLANGYTTHFNDTCYDTVTSYQSLLVQRQDGGQYDSFKSYKAFLNKVAHHKDLAVQVRLLNNYPIQNPDHCVTQEENVGRRSQPITSKMQSALPLIEQLHSNGCLHHSIRRKSRNRRSSAEVATSVRKRSLPNTNTQEIISPTCSLAMFGQTFTFSGNSVSRVCDPLNIAKDNNGLSISHSFPGENKMSQVSVRSTLGSQNLNANRKRIRHYSADSLGHLHKVSVMAHNTSCKCINKESYVTGNETSTKSQTTSAHRVESSLSENQNSPHSSNSDILSDEMTTECDNNTKQNLPLSILSGQNMNNNFFLRLDSTGQCSFPLKLPSSRTPLFKTKFLIAQSRADFFRIKHNNTYSTNNSSA